MREAKWVYTILLILYSIVIIVYILVGSHGRIVFSNSESLKYILMAAVFITTAIISFKNRINYTYNALTFIEAVLTIITIVLIAFQIKLLFPERITLLSGIILAVHLFGILVGVYICVKLFINRNQYLKKATKY